MASIIVSVESNQIAIEKAQEHFLSNREDPLDLKVSLGYQRKIALPKLKIQKKQTNKQTNKQKRAPSEKRRGGMFECLNG